MNTHLASTTTFNESIGFDPTNSFLFKAAMILERVIATVKLKILIEATRLVILGFYDDLQLFIVSVERAEDQCRSEAEYKAIWALRMRVAEKTAKLVQRFEALSGVPYKGRSLADYLVGIERLDELKLFVHATQVGGQGERILARARSDFLASFAKHKLSRNQRAALLEKYQELFQAEAETDNSEPLHQP